MRLLTPTSSNSIKSVHYLVIGFILLLSFISSHAETAPIPRFVMGIYLPGVSDDANLSDIRVAMDYWLQEISHNMNVVDGRAEYFMDMQKMRESFDQKELDMIAAPPLSIIKHFNLANLSNGFMGVRAFGKYNSLLLIAKNNVNIQNLADLRGKRLKLLTNDEMSEVYIETLLQKQFHMRPEQFFKSITREDKNSRRLILDLFFDKTDAALIYQQAYDLTMELNPQIKTKTKILISFPLLSKSYSFFRRDYPDLNTVYNHINQLFDTPRGRQILEFFKSDEVGYSNIDELIPVQALYEEYLDLVRKGKNDKIPR